MRAFRRIVAAAAAAGVVAGLLLTALQLATTVPLIEQAERYEMAAPAAAHEHDAGAWHPHDGFERGAYTALANVVIAIGFGLLLCAVFAVRGAPHWSRGTLWGVAGFFVFFVNPALGLPPVPPGMPEAPLVARQLWWLLAVTSGAGGLYLVVFARNATMRLAGVALLLLPHALGAPQPEVMHGATPATIAERFVTAAAIGNAMFWPVLGALSAWLYRRLG